MIIAFSGLKNSGKDTASQMMQYLLNCPKWLRTYWGFKCFKKFFKKRFNIISFATPIKEMLAKLLNCDVNKFNDRVFKEEYYAVFPEATIMHKKNIPTGNILSDNKFSKLAKNLDPFITNNYAISIRQLMQFFGTNIMRTFFGDSLWVCAALKKDNVIISDLRFKVEMDVIKKYKAVTIFIDRDICSPGAHASEKEVIEMKNDNLYSYIISNNGDLKDLFNELKNII